jgi:hypothetical protein
MPPKLVVNSHFVGNKRSYHKTNEEQAEETDRYRRVCVDIGLLFEHDRAVSVRAVICVVITEWSIS